MSGPIYLYILAADISRLIPLAVYEGIQGLNAVVQAWRKTK